MSQDPCSNCENTFEELEAVQEENIRLLSENKRLIEAIKDALEELVPMIGFLHPENAVVLHLKNITKEVPHV